MRRRYDVKLEAVLRARRRAGRMMPLINVIPPGLDFSSLKVDLPKDPAQGNRPPPKHASFSHHSNPTSPRSADGASPHADARMPDIGSPGDASLAHLPGAPVVAQSKELLSVCLQLPHSTWPQECHLWTALLWLCCLWGCRNTEDQEMVVLSGNFEGQETADPPASPQNPSSQGPPGTQQSGLWCAATPCYHVL